MIVFLSYFLTFATELLLSAIQKLKSQLLKYVYNVDFYAFALSDNAVRPSLFFAVSLVITLYTVRQFITFYVSTVISCFFIGRNFRRLPRWFSDFFNAILLSTMYLMIRVLHLHCVMKDHLIWIFPPGGCYE